LASDVILSRAASRLAGVAVLLTVAGCARNTYEGPTFIWSDDGGCGVPPGYVGINETVTADGGCVAASWCPLDSSPTCVSPPLDAGTQAPVDGGAADGSVPDGSVPDGSIVDGSIVDDNVVDGDTMDGYVPDGGDSDP